MPDDEGAGAVHLCAINLRSAERCSVDLSARSSYRPICVVDAIAKHFFPVHCSVWRAVDSAPWCAHETIQASDLATSTGISRALPSLLRCGGCPCSDVVRLHLMVNLAAVPLRRLCRTEDPRRCCPVYRSIRRSACTDFPSSSATAAAAARSWT